MNYILKKIGEMIAYDGLTIDDMNRMAGGGGKSRSVAAETPTDMNIINSVPGGLLTKEGNSFEADKSLKKESIDKKNYGTRGLQIPLTSTKSDTTTNSAANTGIQV